MSQDPKQRERHSGRGPPGAPKSPSERERATGSDPVTGESSFGGGRPGERTTGTHAPLTGLSATVASPNRNRATGPQAPPPVAGRARATGPQPQARPPAGRQGPKQQPGVKPGYKLVPVGDKQLTSHQKQMESSAFQDMRRLNHLKSVVGTTGERARDDPDDDEATALGAHFDGKTPAPELTARDVFKAVQAPVQSREGRRSRALFTQVLNQFALGFNPRYEPDGPGLGRGHIFVWDVSRAMNCEVPHFIGMKELNLGQTVDWLRHEGPPRGWTRAGAADAAGAANQGMLVIALPREIRLKQLAVVLPLPADPDGRPRLAAATLKPATNLSLYDALGVWSAEYLVHA